MPKSILNSLWLCCIGVLCSSISCLIVRSKSSMLRYHSKLFLSSSTVEVVTDNCVESAANSAYDCPSATLEGLANSPFFIVDPSVPLTERELSDENLILIVTLVASDRQCNALAWKCLGYRYHAHNQTYSNEGVFRSFRARFPAPPDLIGVTRDYSFRVDRAVRDASMQLVRSVPPDFKGGVRSLRPLGFRGFQLKELTPNKTRRAQLANWLIFFRETFFKGRAAVGADAGGGAGQVQQLMPSEQMHRTHRLDQ
ncbi:DUF1823 family protein [archaeon]|nr:MAG: DUF1823 family protein [archaeon]